MAARFLLAWIAALVAAFAVTAQEPIRFPRTPDISPDGKLVAFSYLGDIWVVDAAGGVARPVTMHEAHEINPAFSPDGKWLAFSSNRHGSYDVFVVPIQGGRPRRLTFDSAADFVCGWTPDGKSVLYSSTRSTAFPPGQTLYSVPFEGGAETRLPVTEGKEVAISPRADVMAYVRGPGTWYRKGYRGSSNDDIWLANLDGTNHRRVTNFIGQDSSPMWSPDGKRLYFVSEQFGATANVVYADIAGGSFPGEMTQLTRHGDDAVRAAHISGNGQWIVYECGTDLWIVSTKDGQARKLDIQVFVDDKTNPERPVTFTSGGTDFSPSPDDKFVAFVVHGDLFLMPQAGGKATRLTDHPAFDHAPHWSPDGKKIVFLSDRNGHENLYQLDSNDPENIDITAAQRFKVKQLTNTTDAITGFGFSPDGKRIAFIRSGQLWSMNPDGADLKSVVGEPSVNDFEWSPDSKSLLYARVDGSFGSELYIVPAGGGESKNITRYDTTNYDVTWSNAGMKVAFLSERPGPGGMMMRPYVLPLQKPAVANAPANSEIDWDDIHNRAVLLSPLPAESISISHDGARVAFRSGEDLWVVNSDGSQANRVVAGVRPTNLVWSRKYSGTLFFRDNLGQLRIARFGFGGGEPQQVRFTARATIRRDEEFAEMFEQSWRLLADLFYDVKHHGKDWNAMRTKYRPVVKHIALKEDLYALISLMLGELNASHLGIHGSPPQVEEHTAELGLLFDEHFKGPGLKIVEVLKNGPADKRGLNLKPGEVVAAIDREPITPKTNLAQLFNGKIGETVRLDVLTSAAADPKDPKARRRVDLQTINRDRMHILMYERWCDHNAQRVAELSGGKIGYIHIPNMEQPGLDRFVRALYSDNFDKEAIVLDVRYNGGGFTHDKVLNYLTGKEHTVFRQRDGGEGLVLRAGDRKWTRPLVLLINNESYSDAEIFPSAFRTLGLGKLVGQPTGGFVIGTYSATLIDGSVFRVPRTGVYSIRGVNMERQGVSPDVDIEPNPDDLAKGIDRQLEKAVEVVKADVVAWKKARTPTVTSTGGTGSKPGAVTKP
ncbi:MAG: S41 family peptidase [Gemmataceae bacterium]